MVQPGGGCGIGDSEGTEGVDWTWLFDSFEGQRADGPGEGSEGTVCVTVAMDSACTVGIIGCDAIPYVVEVWQAPEVVVATAKGKLRSDKKGRLHTVDSLGQERDFVGYLVPDCPYSLWPLDDRLQEGERYVQTANSAQIENPDGTVSVLRREKGLWVFDIPDIEGIACAVSLQHQVQGHPHDPKCEHCLRGRQRARKRHKKSIVHIDQRGNTVYFDLMGPFPLDLEGNVYELTVSEGEHGWMEVTGIKDKSSAVAAESLCRVVSDCFNNSNQDPSSIGRYHSGQGKEFAGKVQELIEKSGAVHTDTGGYNSSTNPVEGAQGRLQQTARAMLVQCTGGHSYYEELRGVALKRSAYCINRCSRQGRDSAYKEAWKRDFVWDSSEHVFGARCVFKLNRRVGAKMEAVSEVGIWVGRDLRSNGHWIVPLQAYDPHSMEYTLGKLVSVQTVRVFEDQFPLRCAHTSSTDLVKFEGFIERFDPLYQHVDDSTAAHEHTEYRVKQIIGSRHRGRGKRYVVMWDDGLDTVTVEPGKNLHSDLTTEYEKMVAAAESACAVISEQTTEVERMIEELMRKQKITGSVEEWVPGVTTELESVIEERMEEVSDEVREQVLREEMGMKLRMILERKGDGRKKGRLIGQGFLEGEEVTGTYVDSPVSSFAAVRMLLFMSGEVGDVIASGDISKAFLRADEYKSVK